jgi:putative Ca2+/H+ antiporter (TMEM165/GDT1 family)
MFEWRLFLSTLGVVFLSEMGDKTQITTLLLAGSKPSYVFWVALGSATALICTSFFEVIIGSHVIARFFKAETINLVSAFIFVILGILLISGVIGNIKL